MIYRIFVEKKDNVQARKEAADIKTLLKIATEDFRLVLRYDVEGLTEEEFFNLFKRFEVIVTRKHGGYQDWELDENTIMIDDRE